MDQDDPKKIYHTAKNAEDAARIAAQKLDDNVEDILAGLMCAGVLSGDIRIASSPSSCIVFVKGKPLYRTEITMDGDGYNVEYLYLGKPVPFPVPLPPRR